MTRQVGIHYTADFSRCNHMIVSGNDRVLRIIEDAIKKVGFNVVNFTESRFQPHGYTGVWVIAESHIAVHTWPEYSFVAVDVFSCNLDIDVDKFFQLIAAELWALNIDVNKFDRRAK